MKKILIAGATGYVGRYLVQSAKKSGYYVRALVRNPNKLKETGSFLEPAVHHLVDDLFIGEVTNSSTLKGICDDIEIVISSLGITRQKDKVTFKDVDYLGNKAILEEAIDAGTKKMIYLSVLHAEKLVDKTKLVYYKENLFKN